MIEEPEAHLHPQRQLLLMSFLEKQAEEGGADVQVILTTHSPNIASVLPLNSLVLMQKGRAFSLAEGKTELRTEDYRFLERFLDVTKANLFFARGVMIVEGDAENILLPTLAKLLGRDFAKHGVSIVNVGGVGLGRYAKILMRKDATDSEIGIPVACVTDLDVMPDCAPEILGIKKTKDGDWPPASDRRWLMDSDFPKDGQTRLQFRKGKEDKVKGQGVETFVADKWTLEYDLADTELAEEIFVATKLALADEKICAEEIERNVVDTAARKEFQALADDGTRASEVYRLYAHKTRKSLLENGQIGAAEFVCFPIPMQHGRLLKSDLGRRRKGKHSYIILTSSEQFMGLWGGIWEFRGLKQMGIRLLSLILKLL